MVLRSHNRKDDRRSFNSHYYHNCSKYYFNDKNDCNNHTSMMMPLVEGGGLCKTRCWNFYFFGGHQYWSDVE